MRRCFQCGQRTEAAQLTAVGDGEFCAACFRSLLAAEAEASARREVSPPAAAGSPAALPPRRPSTSRACLVCERSIAGDASVSFLGGDICAECNRQMERELRDGERREAAEQAALAAVPAPTPAAAALGEQGASQPAAFTPGAETRWCAGCERPMPGPGSYRIIAGEPYCPACVPFYSVLNLGAHPRHPAAPEASAPAPVPAAASGACDCCGAALELGASISEGFRFCQACFSSDAELALGVARARHRRKLEALRAAIGTGNKS